METRWKTAFYIIFVIAIAWGLGYSPAQGQEGSPPGAPDQPAAAINQSFTYQGSLKHNGSAVNATCDFQFGLYDAQSLGRQIGESCAESSREFAGRKPRIPCGAPWPCRGNHGKPHRSQLCPGLRVHA